jgi:hypothetical protein
VAHESGSVDDIAIPTVSGDSPVHRTADSQASTLGGLAVRSPLFAVGCQLLVYASSTFALNASISSSIGSAIAWMLVQYSGSYHWAWISS